VTFLDPYELHLLHRHEVIPAATLNDLAQEIGFGLPRWQRLGYLACVLAFVACVVFLIIWKLARRTGIDAAERVLWPLNLTVFAIGAIQFWRSGRRARVNRIRAAMLARRRCPHCGYDIRLLPTDPADGATICPECGCAWKLDDAPNGNAPENEPGTH
jgi:hypothetical protein